MKFGLDTIRELLEDLGDPQQAYPSVLIAGTNGKGSTARFLASIIGSSGLRTGLFTSPHLVRLRERIRVDGREIPAPTFARNFSRVVASIRRLRSGVHPTFFETVTATAFLAFQEAGVELAVLEVGMGGRLDSTNIVEPDLSIITRISHDHQQFLGETLTEIAGEKAGIMREGKLTLSSPQEEAVLHTLSARAKLLGAELEFLDPNAIEEVSQRGGCYSFNYEGRRYDLNTCGKFQMENAALAVRAAEQLRRGGLKLEADRIPAALAATFVEGVIHRIESSPPILIDGGHNPAAAEALAAFLRAHTAEPRSLIFGIMRDKSISEVLAHLTPLFERISFTRIDSPRAAEPDELVRLTPASRVTTEENVASALRRVQKGSRTVVAAGSFYLAGEILSHLTGSART